MRQLRQLYQALLTPYLLFAIVIVLAYGVFLFRWGFYYDDWPEVYLFYNNLSVFDYYRFDRPLLAWTVFLLSKLAGTSPLAWQVLALLLRWVLVSAFYWCFSLLWPKAKPILVIAALLFAVHPAYSLQPIAVTFSKVYLVYAVYFVSLGWMLKSLQASKRSWVFTALSLVAMVYHVFSLEYFWGLELVRPLVIWIALAQQGLESKSRLRLTLRKAAPYLLLMFIMIVWHVRFATYPSDGFYFVPERNQPLVFLHSLLSDAKSLLSYSRRVLTDLNYLFLASWERAPLSVISMQTTVRFSMIILTALVIIFLFFAKLNLLRRNNQFLSDEKVEEIFWFGLFTLLTSLFPAWSVGKHPSLAAPFENRHALAALTGLSLAIATFIFSLRINFFRWGLFTFLMILAFSYQLQNGYDYSQERKWQRAFFWQLYWRAPHLAPRTLVLLNRSFSPYLLEFVHLGPAISILYGGQSGDTSLDYWSFTLSFLKKRLHLNLQNPSEEVYYAVRTLQFRSSIGRALSISYLPEQRCLWVLEAEDQEYPYWTFDERWLVKLSATKELISAQPISLPVPEIFGPEPPHTWCYYFQKASLARQFEDWETVVALGETVFEKNLHPDDVYEWLPFLEGYLHLRRWEQANAIAEEIFRNNSEYRPAVCYLLKTVEKQASSSAKEQLQEFQELWGCTP